MSGQTTEPCWLSRINEIPSPVEEIYLADAEALPQDREWCEALIGDELGRFRLHDYGEIYKVPGLYEKLFYECLHCCSPSRVARLLGDVLEDCQEHAQVLRVLDVGAGNGMMGDELLAMGAERIIGVDIIREARDAADRDRPDVYNRYLVTDLTDLPEPEEKQLSMENLNCLTAVAALGFGDIPPKAFAKALDLITTRGWLAFNIKEDFLSERDGTGFCKLIRQLCREEVIQIQAYWRYQHRLSVTGAPLFYVAVVARKLRDLPDGIDELWEGARRRAAEDHGPEHDGGDGRGSR